MDKIAQIKNQVKKECCKLGEFGEWFYDFHLLVVEEKAKFLLGKIKKANKENVMLAVWLHDLQRVRNIKGDHAKIGAREAAKVLEEYGYNKKVINEVVEIILTHTCEKRIVSKTVEGKILTTADAMSHYYNDFYLHYAIFNDVSLKEYKRWVLEKLNRNINKKIFFPFARAVIKERHDALYKIFTMN
jgi:hypothetical protein